METIVHAGAVTNITNALCQRAQFAENIFCASTSKFKSLITGVLPPLLLTLWQNLFMPQLVYIGAQVTKIPPWFLCMSKMFNSQYLLG